MTLTKEMKKKINFMSKEQLERQIIIANGYDEIYNYFEKEIYHRDKTIELLNEEMLKLRKEVEELKR